jgi:hypothetical protein
MEEIESDCTLVPHQRVKVVPEVSGRIEEVFVREGQAVKKGDPLAQLDISMLETQLKGALEEKLGATAEAERFRGMNEPAGMEIALTRVRAAEAKAKGLQRDIAAATLRSPIDGVVLTKDIELSRGVFLQAGTDFTIIGALDSWDLQVHLHEKQVGRVETLLDERKDVPVRFILYTHNTHELGGVLKDRTSAKMPCRKTHSVSRFPTFKRRRKSAPHFVRISLAVPASILAASRSSCCGPATSGSGSDSSGCGDFFHENKNISFCRPVPRKSARRASAGRRVSSQDRASQLASLAGSHYRSARRRRR